jgi:hypothetical protein
MCILNFGVKFQEIPIVSSKKMKTKIEAPNKQEAEYLLKQKIKIHSIRDSQIANRNTEYTGDNFVEFFNAIINPK